MRRMFCILFVCTGLIFGCNSNKKHTSRGHGKKGKHSAHSSYSSSGMSSSGKSSAADSTGAKRADKMVADTSMNMADNYNSINSRPGILYNGSVGAGTGGSYASASYRQARMNKKNRKELYKNRSYLYIDNIYPEAMRRGNMMEKDTTVAVNSDSTSLNSNMNSSWGSDSTSTSAY